MTPYVIGDVRWSPVNRLIYRCIANVTSATDPSLDLTNWTRVSSGLSIVNVSGTSVTAISGNDYWLNNAGTTAVTAPTPVDGAWFAVTPANGLKTNTIAFGAAIVRGYFTTATGTFPLNLGARMELIYSGTLSRWVML